MKRNAVRTLFLLLALTASICLMSVAAFATDVGSEEALRTAVSAGHDVRLTNDVTLTRKLTVSSSLTIDLNGHDITQNKAAENWNVNQTNYGLIQVQGTSNVTLTLTGSGSITAFRTVGVSSAAGPLSALCAFGPNAHISINGGVSATSDNIALYAYRGGTITIENGASGTFRGLEADYKTGSGTEVAKPDYYLSYTADGKKVLETPFVITESEESAVSPEPGAPETPAPVAQITIKTVKDNAVSSQNTADVTVAAATDTGSVVPKNVVAPTVAMAAKQEAAEDALKTAITANQSNTFTVKKTEEAGVAELTSMQLIQTPAVQNVIGTATTDASVTASDVNTVSVELQTSLTGYEMKEKKDGTVVPTSVTYDVKPGVVLKGEDGAIVLPFVAIANEALAADNLSFTFVLPVPADIADNGAKVFVQHETDEPVEKTVVNHQVEVTADSFSSFIITPVVTEEPSLSVANFGVLGRQLRLDGYFGYLIHTTPAMLDSDGTLLDAYEGGIARFTIGGKREVTVALNSNELETLSDTYGTRKRIYCPVYPNEVNETVTMTVYTKDDDFSTKIDLSENTVESYSFSTEEYLYELKASQPGNAVFTSGLDTAITTYGEYASYYKNRNKPDVVEPTTELADVGDLTQYASNKSYSGDGFGVTFVGGALTLDSRLDIKLYFDLPDGKTMSDYTFRCDGKTLTETGFDSGYNYIRVKNIVPNDYANKTITVTENDNSTDVYTISYGVNTYVKTVLDSVSASSALVKLVKSLYHYGAAASVYAPK